MATETPQRKPNTAALIDWKEFPWWLVLIVLFLLSMAWLIFTGEEYRQAFDFIWGGFGNAAAVERSGFEGLIGRGITMTIYITLVGFAVATFIGLFVGLGRISQNVVIRTLATTYIEFVRGVPTVVLIFTLALVIIPSIVEMIGVENGMSNASRAILALGIIYGAYMAEVFRAGIESISIGQFEAARSLGMSNFQTMRLVVLPQAIRNIMPALGNDFIAILKDSSLVTLLAVRDLTQQAKLYVGTSFRFNETYLVLTFLYLTMTISLSLVLRWYENRIKIE